jgi:D-3-phosphoglycerate dehydrogenase / 2-oxoglutarate reductase
MPKIVISDKLSPLAVDIFKQRGIEVVFDPDLAKNPEKLAEALREADGLAIRSATKANAKVIAAAPKLKVIGRAGIGVDNIDIAAATNAGIVVMNTPFGNAITTAEHAIAMMFAIARQIPEASSSTKQGKWEKSRFMGVELHGKVLGLIGCGNIGSIVADRANGLKMNVVAYDPYLTEERAVELGVEKCELETMLARADFISLHTPLTDQTRNILSKENLHKTKKGVRIINCARGGLIDEDALHEALENGHVAAVALDVYATEPAREHKLFDHAQVVCTPHLGAATNEAQENVAIQIAEQMSDYLLKGAVSNALNMPSITAEEAPRLKPWIALAENLGSFVGQLTRSGLTAIEINYEGNAAKLNIKPLTATIIAHVLKPMLQGVNIVNAPMIAGERGINVTESVSEKAQNYDGLITIRITTDKQTRHVSGTLFGGTPRIVDIKGVAMEAGFAPFMLYVTNEDKPGFIGRLGSVLGEAGINIGTFNLGRSHEGGEAICLTAIDAELSDDLLQTIRELPNVRQAQGLQF